MTEVLLGNLNSSTKMLSPYLPALPPTAPQTATSYARSLHDAPYTALVGVVVDGRQTPRHAASPRYRIRKQVGGTNRWRLPESLGGDLLGTAQAIKSISESYNQSMMSVMTAENPATTVNLDPERPYEFPTLDGHKRPHTMHERVGSKSGFNGRSPSPPTLPRTAPARLTQSPSPSGRLEPPSSACSPTPVDIFHYHSAPIHSVLGPDILLQCLDTNWELHRPYIQKASALTELLAKTDRKPRKELYYRDPMAATLDRYISNSDYYSSEYQEISRKLSTTDIDELEQQQGKKGIDHPSHTVSVRTNVMTKLKLKVKDPLVTREAMAVALGNLYHDDVSVAECDVEGVLASASVLGFKDLETRMSTENVSTSLEGNSFVGDCDMLDSEVLECANIMLKNINTRTVCKYHQAALKYKIGQVGNSCERWLELNLIPQLSVQIYLRELSLELLQKIIQSNRFFTFNEYYLYRLLCNWIFLQLNPHIQLMPSHSTIVTFYNSLTKSCGFIERLEGQKYAGLFMCVRLVSITDTQHIDDMLRMNVIPQQWILKTLSMHYHALQGGGDMPLMLKFARDSIRTGFIIEQEPRYHSEVVSIHGFHFELKAHRQGKNNMYHFYIQRLKPNDPTLCFRICERQTFSLRQDREMQYSIQVQCHTGDKDYTFNTDLQSKKFGLGSKTSRSEVLMLEGLSLPIYVTYLMLFPPS